MQEYSWDLAKYYYNGLDDPIFHQDIGTIPERVKSFSNSYKDTFHTFHTPEDIRVFYEDYSSLIHYIQKPGYYLFYLTALDTQSSDAIKKQRELDTLYAQVSVELLFIQEGWKKIGASTLIELAHADILQPYRNDLISTAERLQYLLDPSAEKFANVKTPTLNLAIQLHDELVGSFVFPFSQDTTVKELTEEEVRAYRQDPDRNLRKEAYRSLRSVYNAPSHQIVLSQAYVNIVKNWTSDMQLRGYDSNVMSQRNIQEQLSGDVVDMLLQEVKKAYPLYHRFLEKKAHLLQIDDFSLWDTTAPIGTIQKKYSFDEAFEMHMMTATSFDGEYARFSQDMLIGGRIDPFPRKGKRSGAFASYRKDDESFVLMNFTGHVRDVFTLSHELGHAYHGHLAQAQKAPVYNTPLVLAETASIFSEKLLAESLKKTLSPEERSIFLHDRLVDTFSTIFRQIQYVLFEKEVHERVFRGEELNASDLGNIWRMTQHELYGSGMIYDVPSEAETTWAQIPHIFHTPFYCYAYAFGNILTLSLYRALKKGDIQKEDYKNLLRSGGSVRPYEALISYGIDITRSGFYQSALDTIALEVEEFESL